MAARKRMAWAIEALAAMGATDISIEPGGKHPKAVFTFEGRTLRMPVPGSLSDSVFGERNWIWQTRRKIMRPRTAA